MAKIINLLPKPRQQEIRYLNILAVLVKVMIFSFVSFALVFLSQFGAKLYLAEKTRATDAEIRMLKEQVDKNDNARLKSQISLINNTAADYLSLSGASPKWSRVMRAFAKIPPPGVRVVNLMVDANSKMATIVGVGPTRQQVIDLYNNLVADDGEFYNVDYPLENVVKAQNVNFHFTFYVRDSLLK